MYKTSNDSLKNLTARALFSAHDARMAGIPPSRLSYYVKKKIIERVGRGVYRGVDSAVDVDFQWEDLVLTAKSVSSGVVCLISALALYELTDEIPRAHWIAIPHATTSPKRSMTRFVRMRDVTTGKTSMKLGGETITIFDRERTIIDAFRYLTLEIGIKALRSAITQKKQKLDIRKLQQYAKKFRVHIDPYIITVTTT
ncbi:MAG: hypothetical protein COY58_09310 [Gammaproteobacteria bacterium CG_4_10_14_0_8_um_filter_38_16]|nr:MAG: hypothetical protein COY58_09310 [Gammaproteobacteria bacterium CG_4_10_14_0_8_um_filter_38_16]PJA03570.1 MAG: hypothetical protein COX72_04510 [Gammaproteobacteria bacterium CG_4_10_14_0_2_um_filter_38_22]PJB10139.1 MAG: hypothetical protein CO120_06420 [Gammaproteobacteria bacterium CG_4_9_14_3_um_filter_38_9]